MKASSLIACVLLSISSFVAAEPTVVGQTISWPDDGWYQVQQLTAQGTVEVCGGTRSCTVTPGSTYIVINHSTGERFENIAVEEVSAASEPTVEGSVISWPDNGWYQVQTVIDGNTSEVCGGTRFCEVASGTYIVINHTTGERFENIVVGSAPDAPGALAVEVEGSVISWPDNGWYQVQTLGVDEPMEVCSGTRFCEVADGSYVVINHTTGERFEPIDVNAQSLPPVDLPIIRASTWREILQNSIALINADAARARHDQLLRRFGSVSQAAIDEVINGETRSALASLGLAAQSLADPENNRLVDLVCATGGQLSTRLQPGVAVYDVTAKECVIEADIYDGAFFHNGVGREGFLSEIGTMGAGFPDGSFFYLSGSLRTSYDRVGVRRSLQWSDIEFEEFSDVEFYIVDAFNLESESYSGLGLGQSYGRVTYLDGTTDVNVQIYYQSASISASLITTALWTGNAPMQVSANLSFEGNFLATTERPGIPEPYETTDGQFVLTSVDAANLPSQWTAGSVEVVAADGSRVSMKPIVDDATTAMVEVSGVEQAVQLVLSDGFQVRCFANADEMPNCQ